MKLGYLSVALAMFCCCLIASTTYYKVSHDEAIRNYEISLSNVEQDREIMEGEVMECYNFYKDNFITLSYVAELIAEGDYEAVEHAIFVEMNNFVTYDKGSSGDQVNFEEYAIMTIAEKLVILQEMRSKF